MSVMKLLLTSRVRYLDSIIHKELLKLVRLTEHILEHLRRKIDLWISSTLV